MNEFKHALKSDFGAELADDFVRRACYYPKVDCIEYLSQDCITVSDRIDEYLTLIWNESCTDLVGFKIKGFRYVFNTIIKPLKNINDEEFDLITKSLEMVFTKVGDGVFPGKSERREEAYRNVITFVKRENVKFEPDLNELEIAA